MIDIVNSWLKKDLIFKNKKTIKLKLILETQICYKNKV